MPITPPSNAVPLAICSLDPTSGLIYSPGCANYSVISTIGTTTVDANTGGGIYYGLNCIALGTTWTAVPYDVYTVAGVTTTNTMYAVQTATAVGFQANPGSGGTGVRFNGNLVVVTGGTPGIWNVLWD